MTLRLEHANLTVRDPEVVIRFLRTALPDLRIRGEGRGSRGARWVHLGTDGIYLALDEATADEAEPRAPYGGRPGLNHLGFEVDDAEAVRARLLAAGYRETTVPNRHPARRRIYFADPEGNDWEFVEYRTADPAERHDYSRPELG